MNAARDESLRGLDGCGCCAGTAPSTPLAVQNRPGLAAVAYRAGTHSTFLRTSLAALSDPGRPPAGAGPEWRPPLQALTARAGDFTPALLDAWAVVGDVLTFYSERIANESWLRTATERRSILELARGIGYELNPGVAASTHLAFTLEAVPGSPDRVAIAPGTRAQSIPGPQEKPQSFETVEPLWARVAWNALRPPLSRPQVVTADTIDLWLAGVPAPVVAGDFVMVTHAGTRYFRTVTAVHPDAPNGRARVTLDAELGVGMGTSWEAYVFRGRAAVFGHNAAEWMLMNDEVRSRLEGRLPQQGHECDKPGQWTYLPPVGTDWPGMELGAAQDWLDLDASYPRILPGSVIVLRDPDTGPTAFEVKDVVEAAPEKFGIGGRVTQVKFAANQNLQAFGRRTTTVFIQPEPLVKADEPVADAVGKTGHEREFPVAGRVEAMEAGRTVIVRGLPARVQLKKQLALHDANGDALGTAQSGAVYSLRRVWHLDAPSPQPLRFLLRDDHGAESLAELAEADLDFLPALSHDEEVVETSVIDSWDDADPARPVAHFVDPLAHVYDRATVVLLGNVALSTHGESVAERLGSGDGARAFQRFTLKQAPLTYTPDDSPGGGASTLEVRVGDLRWKEVSTLLGCGPRDRVYVTRRQDDGATTVQFGDGHEGARLPTGRENVRAVYRKGIGRVGNVRARQLSQLLTRELGVRDVVNPLAASGGMDPQERDDARLNAPVTVLTLDRVVALRDYEDFARAFAGVAKAQAVWTWDRGRRGVFLTVAGPDGDEIPEGGPVQTRLTTALGKAGDPYVPVHVASYRRRRFRVKATLRRDPDRLAADVLAAAQAALAARFGFEARAFGRPVWRNEVIATLQNVPGVVSVDLDLLYREDGGGGTAPELPAHAPADGDAAQGAQPAELLTLHLLPGDLEVAE